jgi:uncharacterized membrane protein YgcG
VGTALQRCSKPKPVIVQKPQPSPREQAEQACRRTLGENGVIVRNSAGRYRCECRTGYYQSRDADGCLSRAQVVAAGERHCASTVPGSRLKSADAVDDYQCACPSSLYYDHLRKACIDWDDVVAHGSRLCTRDGQVLGHVKAFNDYLCCDSDTPYYDKADNKCHSQSTETRAARRDRQAAETRKQRQREDTQKVIEGLTEIIDTIQRSKGGGGNTLPNWPGTTGGGGSSGGGSSGGGSSGGGSADSARCQSHAREAERLSSRMQSVMSRYRGQRDVACEIQRLGEQQQSLLRRAKQAGCMGHISIPNVRYPSFPGCN